MNRRFLCIEHQELETFSIAKLSRNILKLISREFFLLSEFFLPCLSLCNTNACITTSFIIIALLLFPVNIFHYKGVVGIQKYVLLQIHNSIRSLVLISLVPHAVWKLLLFKLIFAALERLGLDLNLLHFSLRGECVYVWANNFPKWCENFWSKDRPSGDTNKTLKFVYILIFKSIKRLLLFHFNLLQEFL